MTRQLNIFSAPEAAEPATPQKAKRAPGKRGRQVKKAPMLLDSYDAGGTPAPRASSEPPPLPPEAHEELAPESGAVSAAAAAAPRVHTVSELTELIKRELEGAFPDLWVTGEVTDFKGRKGHHCYFALKDDASQIRAIIWGGGLGRLPFELQDGLKLICRAKMNVYPKGGSYSLIIDPEHCEPEGIGALKLAFEQLKKRLEAEGLFRRDRKRPIPYLPRRIGIVTAPQGAAVRDLIHVLQRRFPSIEVLLHPVRVQGEGAAPEIAAAIAAMNRIGNLDVLIVGRGGGSMEDLWCFNEEAVARAIAGSRIPVISAVGHEVDFTIADFVADLRAATPSAAAELAVPVRADLLRAIAEHRDRLAGGLKRLLENRELRLRRVEALLADPRRRLPDLLIRLDGLRERLANAAQNGWRRQQERLAKFSGNLDHLSPLGVLAKGYAVAEDANGRAVTSAAELAVGDEVRLRFHTGRADAKVTRIHQGKKDS